jgi:RNA polymerase sigma-70 factor, ECF subfamily
MDERPERDREDREILRRLAAGDRAQLAELYARHGAGVFRHALWVLRSAADAEDVVQAVFVKLATMGAELLGVRQPGTYLAAMVHREATAASRRRAREADLPLEDAALVSDSGEARLEPERVALRGALGRLDAVQREAVYLRVYAGLTFREIGRATGVPTFTAASRYRLAIARLRRDLGEGT